jgi:hypothetical protein
MSNPLNIYAVRIVVTTEKRPSAQSIKSTPKGLGRTAQGNALGNCDEKFPWHAEGVRQVRCSNQFNGPRLLPHPFGVPPLVCVSISQGVALGCPATAPSGR